MKIFFRPLAIVLLLSPFLIRCASSPKEEKNANADSTVTSGTWTEEKANTWYQRQPWLVGANFMPAYAINQLEMWQSETFDTTAIDRELALAEELGMNTMRVFLHDLLYEEDKRGLYERMNMFLSIAARHRIRPLFVFFDSCWDPFPKSGTQRAPKPHTHNSGWVQSPGLEALKDSTTYPRLEKYVKETVARFAQDDRILGWDVWNEPDNMTGPSYEKVENPNKVALVTPLLEKAFGWARSSNPTQPITSGIWAGNWEAHEGLKPIEKIQIEQSDVISFHNYGDPEDFEKRVLQLKRYNKPLLCTEYMARVNNSTFQGILPIAKKHNVAMYNWGFVSGKSQTIYPWDSWTKNYTSEPPVWFHDIFRTDGTPYKTEETDFIKKMTGAQP